MKCLKLTRIGWLILTGIYPPLTQPTPHETIASGQTLVQQKPQAHRDWLNNQALLSQKLTATAKRPDFLRHRPLSEQSGRLIDKLKTTPPELQQRKPKTGARYLVSFSIPKTTLINMLQEAKRFSIPATIRGLVDNTMPATIEAVMGLVEDGQVEGVQIDPQPFTNYHINAVPTLIVQCDTGFDVVRGNLHLEEALSRIAREGDCATTAQTLLEKGG